MRLSRFRRVNFPGSDGSIESGAQHLDPLRERLFGEQSTRSCVFRFYEADLGSRTKQGLPSGVTALANQEDREDIAIVGTRDVGLA
jgi:hypothetical protein